MSTPVESHVESVLGLQLHKLVTLGLKIHKTDQVTLTRSDSTWAGHESKLDIEQGLVKRTRTKRKLLTAPYLYFVRIKLAE